MGRRRDWMRNRHVHRVDKNQPKIVAALKADGKSVQSLAAEGKGVADLLVAWPAPWNRLVTLSLVMEVKLPLDDPSMVSRSRDKRGLTDDQEAWWKDWPQKLVMPRTPEAALKACRRYEQVLLASLETLIQDMPELDEDGSYLPGQQCPTCDRELLP